MKVQTKSGFVCEVDEAKVTDWRFCKALAKCDSGDESAMIQGVTYVVPYLLGDDGEEALINHVTDKNGIAPTEKIIEEFKEIMTCIGSNAKKSPPSQD